MNSDKPQVKPNFLRLVDTKSTIDPILSDTFVRPAWQSTLFANDNPSLLLFVNFEEINENDFTTVLSGARPKFLFDIRRVPRFDLGSLNRKQAFALFSMIKTRYIDLSVRVNHAEEATGEIDPVIFAKLIMDSSNLTTLQGPLAFLVDAQNFDESNISRLIGAVPSYGTSPWDVLRVPIYGSEQLDEQSSRSVIFISHANPEDNAFATWLSGQLTLAGYSVWSDVTQLIGGETFWDDIEETIRQRAAKVIAVLSVSAQRKAGVLDEIDLAVRVERSRGLKRFVLPVRLDELSHSDVRANIARKNVIDFKDNWALGLHSLLSVLERDRVPRSSHSLAGDLSRWVTKRCAQTSTLVSIPEKLTSNWLRIARLPEHIFLHNVSAPLDRIDSIAQSLRRPSFRYLRLIGSFAMAEDLQQDVSPEISVTEAYRIKLEDFLRGRPPELPGLPRWEANRLTVSLLRQAWNLCMERQGLRPFETASRQLAWYMPKGRLEGNRIEFQDDDGKKRRKALVGWSERRKVFWHFAVEARPVLGELPHFVLKQHVIFTPDGITPVESKERMHLLRRRFCKNWWNDRWRDLLIAFLTWLNETEGCALSTGSISSVQLEERLMSVISPMSIGEDELLPLPRIDPDDELSSDDDDDSLDDMLESDVVESVEEATGT
jgi:hypothetical protein